jgi:hypothetical protein
MSYAIRKDGLGWRSVASAAEVGSDEVFSTNQPVLTLSANEVIISQIAALEATVTPRRIREAVLGSDSGWLANINNQIAILRGNLS